MFCFSSVVASDGSSCCLFRQQVLTVMLQEWRDNVCFRKRMYRDQRTLIARESDSRAYTFSPSTALLQPMHSWCSNIHVYIHIYFDVH